MKAKILFLASNPMSETRLALDEEARDIEHKLHASKHRDSFEFKTQWAVRPDDLQDALLREAPTVVHFSGHGAGPPGLVLHGEVEGQAILVTADALRHLLRALKDGIRVVLLNACYSAEQAAAIVEEIDFVIGMKDSIGDRAARVFSAAFYRGLGFGRSVKTAFDLGISAIKLERLGDDDLPVLLVRNGVSSDVSLLPAGEETMRALVAEVAEVRISQIGKPYIPGDLPIGAFQYLGQSEDSKSSRMFAAVPVDIRNSVDHPETIGWFVLNMPNGVAHRAVAGDDYKGAGLSEFLSDLESRAGLTLLPLKGAKIRLEAHDQKAGVLLFVGDVVDGPIDATEINARLACSDAKGATLETTVTLKRVERVQTDPTASSVSANTGLPTRIFISYTHDSDAHKTRVLRLAKRLRADGLDCQIDRFVNGTPPEGWPLWMARQIEGAAFVLVVCTGSYLRRFDAKEERGKGLGATWEAILTRQVLYEAQGTNEKFVPVVFEGASFLDVPKALRPFTYYQVPEQYEALYRHLTNQPEVVSNPMGQTRVLPPISAPGSQPRGTEPEAPPERWHLAHPYGMLPNFTGRGDEQSLLGHWLDSGSETILVLRALGGFGKSALAWHWLLRDVDPSFWPSVVWWDFYDGDGNFERFLKETLKYLGAGSSAPQPEGPIELTDALVQRLESDGTLLILDGFERSLRGFSGLGAPYRDEDDPGHQNTRTAKSDRVCISPAADRFLRRIATLPRLKGRVLLTTRVRPVALEGQFGELLAGCREHELLQMADDDAVHFMRSQGIRGSREAIQLACSQYGYHPLSLRLLAGVVVNHVDQAGDIAVARSLDVSGDLVRRRTHVLKRAYEDLDLNVRSVLDQIACLRGAVKYETLRKALPAELSDHLTAPLLELAQRGLLHRDKRNNRHDLHPIVRRYVYQRFAPELRKSAHLRLADYFRTLPLPTDVSTVEDLATSIERFYHSAQSGDLDSACDFFRQQLNTITYERLGAYSLRIELLRLLFPNGEAQPPVVKGEDGQAWACQALANAYGLTGQGKQAIPLYERQIAIRSALASRLSDQESRRDNAASVAVGISNLGSEQAKIGALRAAEASYRRQIALFEDLGDDFRKGVGHAELGRLLAYAGRWEESESELATSLGIFEAPIAGAEGAAGHGQATGVARAYQAIRLLLLGRGGHEPVETTESDRLRAREILELLSKAVRSSGSPSARNRIRLKWLEGAASRLAGERSKADACLVEALTDCRRIGMLDHEADILVELARLRLQCGDIAEARSLLSDEALPLVEGSGYSLQEADTQLLLAQIALRADERPAARRHCEAALRLARCDGPPAHAYKAAYEEAQALLARLQ